MSVNDTPPRATTPTTSSRRSWVVERIHAACPLEQVVFWGVKKWGRAPTKLPIAGPSYARLASSGRYGGPRNNKLGRGAVDAAFEKGAPPSRHSPSCFATITFMISFVPA
jgi:hypothetical protein